MNTYQITIPTSLIEEYDVQNLYTNRLYKFSHESDSESFYILKVTMIFSTSDIQFIALKNGELVLLQTNSNDTIIELQ